MVTTTIQICAAMNLCFLLLNSPGVSAFSPSTLPIVSAPTYDALHRSRLGSSRIATSTIGHAPSSIATSSTFCNGISSNGRSYQQISFRDRKTHLQSTSSSSDITNNNNPFLSRNNRIQFEIQTLLRVLLPATICGLLSFISLPILNKYITNFIIKYTMPNQINMLNDAVTSFISLVGLLYSILVGQVFGFLYSQQEALYYALFDEVTEAKSLLEQVALVSQGRSMYSTCLNSIARYVKDDLLGGTLSQLPTTTTNDNAKQTKESSISPSLILSARPADDPLEAILYLTSVGIPGQIYDTVRSLRQARSRRLGALQRKVPVIHLIMLGILGLIMVGSFPILVSVGGVAASTSSTAAPVTIGKSLFKNAMTLQGGLFGVATFAVVMTKMVLRELWRTKGGAYNVDAVLRVMVRGLQKELDERMIEATKIMKRKAKD